MGGLDPQVAGLVVLQKLIFCQLVSEAWPEAQEGSLVGGPAFLGLLSAHWYADLSPKPLAIGL